ncbi:MULTISPECIES: Asp23/Gls24 family envelope stress response protein [Arthrobacter]|uniref:Asp23/Gls24 family envelope stress response protein n=1 Tax=Arthrobacter oryzae TaxID=409290 RepID=A0A3N0BVV7_9MICC|nr:MULTISPECIES: Asp23/Gls24 family envelope stress response protein [Arthrobacter]QYF89975.1 Asp23/Gls24 family envelope stress response protein [Arthrobacter sp. PAMC25284]RNL53830.1 Asp23/Gls24 family envelope stress response protein [Arthrobacter oryzae]
MNEKPVRGQLIDGGVIADLAIQAVLDTPGVLRLEPTLRNLLTGLGPRLGRNLPGVAGRIKTSRHNGVWATIRDGRADVQVDIATDITFTALAVAEDLQQLIRKKISLTGLEAGRIDVTILAVEAANSGRRSGSGRGHVPSKSR